MSTAIPCPSCQTTIKASEKWVGKKCRCQQCGAILLIGHKGGVLKLTMVAPKPSVAGSVELIDEPATHAAGRASPKMLAALALALAAVIGLTIAVVILANKDGPAPVAPQATDTSQENTNKQQPIISPKEMAERVLAVMKQDADATLDGALLTETEVAEFFALVDRHVDAEKRDSVPVFRKAVESLFDLDGPVRLYSYSPGRVSSSVASIDARASFSKVREFAALDVIATLYDVELTNGERWELSLLNLGKGYRLAKVAQTKEGSKTHRQKDLEAYAKLASDSIDLIRQLNEILKTIKDEASAKQASTKIDAMAKSWRATGKRYRAFDVESMPDDAREKIESDLSNAYKEKNNTLEKLVRRPDLFKHIDGALHRLDNQPE